MLKITHIDHNIDLDFSTSDIKRTVIKQDSDKTHVLKIKLYDNHGIIELDHNWRYTISCRKADDTFIVNSSNISLDSNTMCVEMTKQMLSCPGTMKCELIIQNDNQSLYSNTFYIYIEENINDGSVLESANEYNSLTDVLDKIKDHEKDAEKTKDHIHDVSYEVDQLKVDIEDTYDDLKEAVKTTDDLIKENQTAVSNANEATAKANEATAQAESATIKANNAADDLQQKLDSHHFVLTEDKDCAGGVPSLDSTTKIPVNELYDATTSSKGITQLTDSVSSSSTTTAATPNSVKKAYDAVTELETRLNAIADSDDTTLDQLSEIIAYIKSNRSLIDDITTRKVSVSDIVDNLTSTATNKPLSANQGKILNDLLISLSDTVSSKVDNVDGKGLSTNDYTTDEKTKLSEIASGAEVNVQSDWDVTDPTDDAFIKNRPKIPTKISELTNDSNFTTECDINLGTPTVTVDNNTGIPSGSVTLSEDSNGAKVFNFSFHNLKGEKGDTGSTGGMGDTDTGVCIDSISVSYQASSSGTDYPTESWLSLIPSVSAGQYLWTRIVIIYTDDSETTFYNVSKMGETGEKGDPGVGISDISDVTVSTDDGGTSIYRINLTDGSYKDFSVKNGSNGSSGATGTDEIHIGTSAPSDEKKIWIDTGSGGITKYYNGSDWTATKAVWG